MRWNYIDTVDLDSWTLLGSAVTGNNSEVFLVIYPSWCSKLAGEGGGVVERAVGLDYSGYGVHHMVVFLMLQFFHMIVNMLVTVLTVILALVHTYILAVVVASLPLVLVPLE
jgi:hypothetical protein